MTPETYSPWVDLSPKKKSSVGIFKKLEIFPFKVKLLFVRRFIKWFWAVFDTNLVFSPVKHPNWPRWPQEMTYEHHSLFHPQFYSKSVHFLAILTCKNTVFLLENRYISSLTFEGRSLYIETLEAHLVIGLFWGLVSIFYLFLYNFDKYDCKTGKSNVADPHQWILTLQ